MPQKIISSGELAKDQYITVLEHISSSSDENGEDWKNTKVKEKEITSGYEGKVFQVVHVQLPFVIVKYYYTKKLIYNKTFDTRKVNFMEISKEYVEAVLMEY